MPRMACLKAPLKSAPILKGYHEVASLCSSPFPQDPCHWEERQATRQAQLASINHALIEFAFTFESPIITNSMRRRSFRMHGPCHCERSEKSYPSTKISQSLTLFEPTSSE